MNHFLVLSLSLGLVGLAAAPAHAQLFTLKADSKIQIRVLSASWCGPCRALKRTLTKEGAVKDSGQSFATAASPKESVSISEGTFQITVRKQTYKVDFDQLEGSRDGVELVKQLHVMADIAKINLIRDETKSLPFVPFTQVYVDGKVVYGGFTGGDWGLDKASIEAGLSGWITRVTATGYKGTGYLPKSDYLEPDTRLK